MSQSPADAKAPVPSGRLIALSLGLLPVALLAAAHPAGMALLMLSAMLLLSVSLADRVLKAPGLAEARVTGVQEIRQANHQTGTVRLRVEMPAAVRGAVTFGLAFPPQLGAETESVTGRVEGDPPGVRAVFSFTPCERGEYAVREGALEVSSRLGLWRMRRRMAVDLVFRVYPDLRRERRVMANLFLNRGQSGLRQQRITGQGRDYDQIREYRPGDTPADIHWKASAKRSELVTKTYQIERTQEVYLVIDHSRLSARPHPGGEGRPDEPVLERYVAAANLLAMAAVREGDLFGLMTFARMTDTFVRAGSGTAHLRTVQNSLFRLKPEPVYPDIDEWVRFTRVHVRRRSLMILLTDLSDATTFDLLEKRVHLLSRSHLVVVAMIPLPGVAPLFAGREAAGDPWEALAGHLMWRDLQGFRTRLRALNVPLLLPGAETLALDVINQYLTIKQTQRL
ncbi:MAG: DUF58 domain-containing protein [Verrucomicrobia bacterium]|nr:DUF58 domain-containing protein [Verrucomicrobiota bacterium]MCH8526483.1 DUF58 domain-containing protein [Kiritimatiellia bacterium]